MCLCLRPTTPREARPPSNVGPYLPRPPPLPGSTRPADRPLASRGPPPMCTPKVRCCESGTGPGVSSLFGRTTCPPRLYHRPLLLTWRRCQHGQAAPALPGTGGRTNDATSAVVPTKGRTRRASIPVVAGGRKRLVLLQQQRPTMTSWLAGSLLPPLLPDSDRPREVCEPVVVVRAVKRV